MQHTDNELKEASNTIAAIVLIDRLNGLLPATGDAVGSKRFMQQAQTVLADWLQSRLESDATQLDKAA